MYPTATRSRCMRRRAATRPSRKALASDPDSIVNDRQGLRAARPRRRRLPLRPEVDLPPKDRKETLMCVNADESEPATFNNRLLMEKDPHQFLEGILISCFATRRRRPTSTSGSSTSGRTASSRRRSPRRGRPATWARTSTARASTSRSTCTAGRGLHLRRGDRADREPRGQAGLAADQAAVPRHRGGVPQADGRQQRRNALLRAAHHRARRDVVQVDRRAQELRARSSTASPDK